MKSATSARERRNVVAQLQRLLHQLAACPAGRADDQNGQLVAPFPRNWLNGLPMRAFARERH